MPVYMMQMAYTSEVWATLVKNPEDRSKSAQSLAESLGGKSLGFWLSFGEYDLLAIFEMPDEVSIAALAMAVAAGGALKDIKTTPLISTFHGVQAMTRAQTLEYSPPGARWSARTSWSEASTT